MAVTADLEAKAGQRYAAVFASAPHQVGHEVKAAGETWLLRTPPGAPAPAR